MLANFLEKSKPINFVVYLGLFFAFFIFEIYTTFFLEEITLENVLKSIVFFILFLLIFFFLNFIVIKNNLTFDNTFAYFLCTLFFIVFIEDVLTYTSLLSILFYFLFLRKMYSLRTSKRTLQKLFDTSFWLGVLIVFQPNCILFLLLVYTAVLVYRGFNIQTFLIPLIGVLVPIFIYFSYHFWHDQTAVFLNNFNTNQIKFGFSTENNWFIICISLLSIIAFLIKTPKVLPISNTFRMSWILVNINYLLAFSVIFVSDRSKELSILYLLFPASIVITNGMELIPKKGIQSIVFSIIILAAILGWWFL